jgi:hypothetical protein
MHPFFGPRVSSHLLAGENPEFLDLKGTKHDFSVEEDVAQREIVFSAPDDYGFP